MLVELELTRSRGHITIGEACPPEGSRRDVLRAASMMVLGAVHRPSRSHGNQEREATELVEGCVSVATHTVHEQLQNPLTRVRDTRDRSRLATLFPDLASCVEPHYLGLRRYVERQPERFFDRAAHGCFLEWLKKRDAADGNSLKGYLASNDVAINQALLFLREINSEKWHDGPLTAGGEFELVRSIGKYVHPTYLRLVEAVLAPLTRPVAHFSRLDRRAGTDGLDIWQIAQELSGHTTGSLL